MRSYRFRGLRVPLGEEIEIKKKRRRKREKKRCREKGKR